MGLLLAGLFGCLNRSAWVASGCLALLAVLAASSLPAAAGLGLLLAVEGPLLVGAFRVPGPVHPGRGITGATPSQ